MRAILILAIITSVSATCFDNAQNGFETDVDCGGTCWARCMVGERCMADVDCETTNCVDKICDLIPTRPLRGLEAASGAILRNMTNRAMIRERVTFNYEIAIFLMAFPASMFCCYIFVYVIKKTDNVYDLGPSGELNVELMDSKVDTDEDI